MRNIISVQIIFLLCYFLASCGPLTVNISYPDIQSTEAPGTVVIFLRSVVDNRRFLDHNSALNVPSWASTFKEEENRKMIIGRSARSNIYLADNNSIESLIGEIIKNSFFKEGYSVIYKEKSIPGAIEVDAFINNFWVYRVSKDVIQAKMDILFAINGQGALQTRTITATGSNTVGNFEGMENWETAVNAMLDEFTHILRNDISNGRRSPTPGSDNESQEELLKL